MVVMAMAATGAMHMPGGTVRRIGCAVSVCTAVVMACVIVTVTAVFMAVPMVAVPAAGIGAAFGLEAFGGLVHG